MKSLRDVCYEQIKDNFFYGLFGDIKIIVDCDTGFFNATKLCIERGKRFRNWKKSKQAMELLEFYRLHCEASSTIYEINKAGDQIYNKIINGTYVSEHLICILALWISADFFHKVNTIVISYISKTLQDIYQGKISELERKIREAERSMKLLGEK